MCLDTQRAAKCKYDEGPSSAVVLTHIQYVEVVKVIWTITTTEDIEGI